LKTFENDRKGESAVARHIETCFNYCSLQSAFFSSDEKRWINKIHRLKKQHPEDITILREPEDNDGCIYCALPVSYLKVQAPAKRELTEEQKEALRARLPH
jgi:hypothetical protein